MGDKVGTAFRLSKEARDLLVSLAKKNGISKTAVVEMAIRKIAFEQFFNLDYEQEKKELIEDMNQINRIKNKEQLEI